MKVKELRSWLENFGEKHRQHYKRGFSHIPEVNQDDENLLSIQTKPSNASTSPMSSSDSVVSFKAQFNPSDLEGRDSYYPDPSFVVNLSDDSSVEGDEDLEEFQLFTENFHPDFKEANDGLRIMNSRRVTFGGIQGGGGLTASVDSKRAPLVNDATGVNSPTQRCGTMIKGMDPKVPDMQKAKSIFRKKIDPGVLEFLQPNVRQPSVEHSARKPVRAPRSSVGAAIELFGGQGSRKTIVSRRTDELQRLWSESRAVTHVKKTKWCVCEKTGVYKRKIVVEPEYKSK